MAELLLKTIRRSTSYTHNVSSTSFCVFHLNSQTFLLAQLFISIVFPVLIKSVIVILNTVNRRNLRAVLPTSGLNISSVSFQTAVTGH